MKTWRERALSGAEFLLYSSLFISICAVALCMETNLLLGIPFQGAGFYVFVGCATLVQYNLHYYIKVGQPVTNRRTEWSQRHKHLHQVLIVGGTIGIVAGLFTFTFHYLAIVGFLGVLTLLYSFPFLPFKNKRRLKDFGGVKILVLTLTWTIITVWLPVAESGWNLDIWLIFIRRFLFMGALCLAFDIRDAPIDSLQLIRTIPVKFGTGFSYKLIYGLLGLFILVSIYHLSQNGHVYHFNAMMLSAMATFILVEKSRRDRSDLLYLGGIDGMMLLQAILVLAGS